MSTIRGVSENAEEQNGREAASPGETEDDRRRRAAEANRKAADEQWQRNKKEWLERNFPEKSEEGGPA